MRASSILALSLSLSLVPALGCNDKPKADTSRSVFDDKTPKDQGAGAATGQLPPGHPPMGSGKAAAKMGQNGGGMMGIPTPPKDIGKGKNGLTWTLPKGWKEVAPANAMRRAQFEVDGPGGKAECAVFYFGPGQGGDPLSNARRWANQFQQPDGKPSTEVMKTGSRKAGNIDIVTVEVTGTYANTMTGGAPKANQMLLGAIAQGPDAPWFFKLIGPKETVEANRKAFEQLLDSLKPGA